VDDGKRARGAGVRRQICGVKLHTERPNLLKLDAHPATVFLDVEDVTPAHFAAESSAPHRLRD